MEFEQLVKRLDWLEKEYRKSKETISALEEKSTSLEKSLEAATKQIKDTSKDMREVSGAVPRMDQFEDMLSKQRTELSKMLEENDKRAQQRERQMNALQSGQVDEVKKTLADLIKDINPSDLKKRLKEGDSETKRFLTTMNTLKERVEKAVQTNDDVIQGQKLMDTARKNDLKLISDMQGEVTALRKRVDESRDKSVLMNDAFKNLENRVNELLSTELERKQSHNALLEQHAVSQRDRDRSFKEWDEKYAEFKKETEVLQAKIVDLDETLRLAKKAQETYNELNTKLERRINEITEMQRLAEDRLRQEWISFKADDQKRWTGYTLSSEESGRELRKDITKLEERLTSISDSSQLMQDQLHQTADVTEKKLEDVINSFHEWKESTERIMGHSKAKKTKK